jgi:hypothetical protein
MKQYILLSFFLFVLFSCGNEPKTANDVAVIKEEQPALPIREFIKKFKLIQPPFYYLGGNLENYYEKQLFELKKNSIDTLFYTERYDVPVYGFGMLADTSNFYSLILVHTAENNYPVLYTWSKSGKLLSQQQLLVRGCGSDCGLKYCSYAAHIDKDLSIYIADTSRYEGMCDSAGNYIVGDSTFIFSRTGSIDKNGKIKMSEELEQRTGRKK